MVRPQLECGWMAIVVSGHVVVSFHVTSPTNNLLHMHNFSIRLYGSFVEAIDHNKFGTLDTDV